MPEDINQNSSDSTTSNDDSDTLHTCECGEQHRHRAGSPSHRDECTSPKKFGESCCCGPAGASGRHGCGHGPRCH